MPRVYSQIMLTSSLVNNAKVCPGDEIIFTCETRGSSILAWSSAQYIGGGGVQFEFTTDDTPGLVEQSRINADVIATLTSTDAQSQTISSTLRIVASSDVSAPSVTCLHRTDQINKTSRFQYLGMMT